MVFPMENICRICVKEKQGQNALLCVFSTTVECDQKEFGVFDEREQDQDGALVQTVAQAMASCLDVDIKPTDELPQQVCQSCLSKLKESWILRETSKVSEKRLRRMLRDAPETAAVKNEISVEDFHEDYNYLVESEVEEETLEEFLVDELPARAVDPEDPLHSEFGWPFSNLQKGHFKVRRGDDSSWDLLEVDDYRCCGCFQFFDTKHEMEEHCKRDHKEEPHGNQTKRYECSVCLKLFSSPDAMTFHQKMARSKQLFHCKLCHILSPSKRQLKAHLKLHDSSSLQNAQTSPPKPHTTGLVFSKQESLAVRPARKAIIEPPSRSKCRTVKTFITFDYMTFDGFCCCDCWTYCESKREMKRHGEKEHYGNRGFEEDHVCFACWRSFEDKSVFQQHMAELNAKHIYYCKTCNLMFRTSDKLQEHQQTSFKHEGFVELEMIDIKEEVEVEVPVLKIQPMPTAETSRRKQYVVEERSESPAEDIDDGGGNNHDDADDVDFDPDDAGKTQRFEEPYGQRLYAPKMKRNDPDLAEISVVDISSQDTVRCCGCYQTFITEEETVEHSNQQHRQFQVSDDKERPYECDRCYRRFNKAVSLQIHRQFSKSVQVYACKLCDEKFCFQTPFLLHYNQHEKHFPREDKRGAKAKVTIEDNKYYCCFNLCKQSYPEYSELLTHVDDTHGVKRNQFKDYRDTDDNCCEVCFRSFNNYRALLRHVTQQKKPVSARHTCSTCGVQTKSLAALKDHENKHLGIKPYECEICSKTFGTKTILKNHMIVHQTDRPFSCEICGKTFARKRNWKDHSMTHMDEKPWECEICKLTFRIESQFLTHKRRHTGVRPYKCKFCDKVFSHATDRKRHEMAAHTGEKPHQCSFCTLAFIRKRQLVIHERTHTGEKPFECQYCGQAFIQQSYLTRHLATHRQNASY